MLAAKLPLWARATGHRCDNGTESALSSCSGEAEAESERQLLLQRLSFWLKELNFQAISGVFPYMLDQYGSAALLQVLPAEQPSGEEGLWRGLPSFFHNVVLVGLSQPERMGNDDLASWMRRLLNLPDSDVEGVLQAVDRRSASASTSAGASGSNSSNSVDLELRAQTAMELTDLRLQQLLQSVSPAGDLAAVVEVSFIRAGQLFAASQGQQSTRILVKHAVAALMRLSVSERSRLSETALKVAVRCLPEYVPPFLALVIEALHQMPKADLLQLIGIGDARPTLTPAAAHAAALGVPPKLVSRIFPPMEVSQSSFDLSKVLTDAVTRLVRLHNLSIASSHSQVGQVGSGAGDCQPEVASLSDELPLATAIQLLRLVSAHLPIRLPVHVYELVAEAALCSGQEVGAMQVLSALLNSPANLVPSFSSNFLQLVVQCCAVEDTEEGASDGVGLRITMSTLLSAASTATCLGPPQIQLLVRGLLEASAEQRSGAWALAAMAALPRGNVSSDMVSRLVEAFLHPVVEGNDAVRSGSGDSRAQLAQLSAENTQQNALSGIEAALMACAQLPADKLSDMAPSSRDVLAAWLLADSSNINLNLWNVIRLLPQLTGPQPPHPAAAACTGPVTYS